MLTLEQRSPGGAEAAEDTMAAECAPALLNDEAEALSEQQRLLVQPDVADPAPDVTRSCLEDIEFIDSSEETVGGGGGRDDEATQGADAAEAAACRLRRWRPVSRRTRAARDSVEERLQGLSLAGSMSASAGELPTLAPPAAPAATVPSSPSCLPVPSLGYQNAADCFGSSPECYPESPAPPPGPRYKLATESPLQICCYDTNSVIEKIFSSKFLRRWETHVLVLQDDCISSKTPSGLLKLPLYFSSMQEVYCISRWDRASKFCLRVKTSTKCLLIQAGNAYTRGQWYHSILWKKNMTKYRNLLAPVIGTERREKDIILKDLKNMVDYVMTSPLHDNSVANVPLQLLTNLLSEEKDTSYAEEMVSACAPLLAEHGAQGELCAVLARLCRRRPRTAPLPAALAPPVRRVLKRNVDFTRAPNERKFVCDYISALGSSDSGAALVRRFVEVAHGPAGSACPHPRAAPNLAAVALASLNDLYRDFDEGVVEDTGNGACFADVLLHMSEYQDWLVVVGGLIQPVPLAPAALMCPAVAARLAAVLSALASDQRCVAHGCLAPPRTSRSDPLTWLKAASPADPSMGLNHQQLCKLWGDMLGSLLNCCYMRKSFLQDLTKQLPDFLLVALTEHPAALAGLCLMLEWNIINDDQTRLEIIAALQATEPGQKHYQQLCDREQHLKQLQAVGGPKRLALPVKATDADLARLLAAGSFGNLECLSLAFTSVTSACAYQLIKLPRLRYLNLWATQFGDAGIRLIAEHLPRLQVLNLCETPISDKGIEALAGLRNLRRLNLNSTNLSAEAFGDLKQRLPQLQDFDVRYTEAWCSEDLDLQPDMKGRCDSMLQDLFPMMKPTKTQTSK